MYTILTVTFVVHYLLTILCTSVLFLFAEHQGLEVSEVFGVELSDWSDTQSIKNDKITSFEQCQTFLKTKNNFYRHILLSFVCSMIWHMLMTMYGTENIIYMII
jgi:hypothetical protein